MTGIKLSTLLKSVWGFYNKLTLDMRYFNIMKYPEYIETQPVDNKAIIVESQHGLDIDGNIYHALKQLVNDPNYSSYTIYVSADAKNLPGIRAKIRKLGCEKRCIIVKLWSKAYLKAVATSKYLINDNTWLPFFIKREEQVYLNLWHGTPLKTLGRSDKLNRHNIGNAQKNFFMADYLLFPNEFTRDRMVKDYMLENLSKAKLLIDGYPRNGVLNDSAVRDRVRSELGLEGIKVFTYMPTWRNEDDSDGLMDLLRAFDARLEEDELMYIKLHPVSKENLGGLKLENIRFVPEDIELYEFLSATDALITDYSSVMFDYAVTGRPVSLYIYDYERYMTERGLYMDIAELPWKYSDDPEEVLANARALDNVAEAEWLARFNPYDDGLAAERILSYVILNKETGIRRECINTNGLPNVLIYGGDLSRNGVTSALKSILNGLDTGTKNYYLTFNSSAVYQNRSLLEELPEGIRYIAVAGKMNATFGEKYCLLGYAFGFVSFEKFMKHSERIFRRDILRNYYNISFDSVIQFSGYAYKKIIGFTYFDAKRIIYVHSDMLKEIRTRGVQRLEVLEYVYNTYDTIVAVSDSIYHATCNLIRMSKYPDTAIDKLRTINSPLNYDSIIKRSKCEIGFSELTECNRSLDEVREVLDGDHTVIVSVGRYSREKGHDRLLDAFCEHWKRNRDNYLIIIGGNQMDNIYDNLVSKLHRLECRNNVILIHRMDNPFTIVSRADGFILASYYEGFGLVIMEADILGIPVVITDIDGPKKFMNEYGGTIVDNTYEGVLKGLSMLNNREIKTMKVDYEKLRQESFQKFYELIN